jgi:glutaredoxin
MESSCKHPPVATQTSSVPDPFSILAHNTRGNNAERRRSTIGARTQRKEEDLDWRGMDFVEYDVEKDQQALQRMLELTSGNRTVPVISEEGKPVQIGWMGRGCAV